MTHTPGPWTYCGTARGGCQCGYIFGDGGRAYVAQAISERNVDALGCPDPHPTADAGKANARLIAAAPDMLAALWQALDDMQGGLCVCEATKQQLRDAAAKAECGSLTTSTPLETKP